MGLTRDKVVSAGFHHHFVSQHLAEVDEEVLERIIVWLDVRVREGRARVLGRMADLFAKFSVHPQKFTDWGC